VPGPLVANWSSWTLEEPHAGSLSRARIEVENAGAATWRPHRIKLSYHWLDERGNAIVWDGIRTELETQVEPGDTVVLAAHVRGPIPPGRYRLAFDLVEEGRFWLAELGNRPLELDVDVEPRDADGAVAHLPDSVEPAADWHARVHAAHERGYAAVGGSLEVATGRFGRVPKALQPYAPGGGRNPAFGEPLVCPSLLPPLQANAEVAGLPAWRPEGDEPWLYDGTIKARLRAGRRHG